MKHLIFILTATLSFITTSAIAQDVVEIQDYSINNFGQVQLEIEANADEYYLLSTIHGPNLDYVSTTSMTLGVDGDLIISEPLSAYPEQNYTITAWPLDDAGDIDLDGINDVVEINDTPDRAPLNYAQQIPFYDGSPIVTSHEMFSNLSVIEESISWAPFLNNQEFVKFAIVNIDSDKPEIYFINSTTHAIHNFFLATIGLNLYQDDVVTGEIVYNPNDIFYNGAIGSYSFNFSFGRTYQFSRVQKTFELLATNMPYLNNNLQHFVGANGEDDYNQFYKDDYTDSRIPVVLESVFFEDVDYIPLHEAEGYGFFRHMELDENPGSRDIVLYDALPNTLPRVGGIITSVIQTPLSHVNLRAIQDNLPNSYIKNPLEIDSIANLLDGFIYYKVENERYTIREATIEEVNAWYEDLRPTEDQVPPRDLSRTDILPLDEITFDMADSFGAKCTNVATMRTFGFPEGTIPDGFGVPFYYYDEFMKFNGFYEQAQTMIEDPDFIGDLETRIEMLSDFRKDIRDGELPQWMLDNLQEMHDAFPEGTAVRVRSSTNNEDLPGFSGAGLYTSKTQHLDEGHISKSVKQVYASIWNFRAFDEREFYRVDNFVAAMGLLCHPNYQEEKSNGVGVSIDPLYQTNNTFYLNTQVGESLITNPDANSIPEELLLDRDADEGYYVIRNSNLVPNGELVMSEAYLDQMREYLEVIHNEFAILYNVVGAEGFGMDIEYKVTAEDQLIIKQARPWVSFWADINAEEDLGIVEISDPNTNSSLGTDELVTVKVENQGLREMSNFDLELHIDDQLVETITITEGHTPQSEKEYEFTIPQDFSTVTITSLHLLEAELKAELGYVGCGNAIEAAITISNYGSQTFTNQEIEVTSNGIILGVEEFDNIIPNGIDGELTITITDNLNPIDNLLEFRLVSVNGQADAIDTNNSSSFMASLENAFQAISLEINSDNYAYETSWQITLQGDPEVIASGSLSDEQQNQTIVNEYCLDYNQCYILTVFDSYGDGICCNFGEGNFSVYLDNGQQIIFDNGDFDDFAIYNFCPSDADCVMSANYATINASNQNSEDGELVIFASGGEAPYTFSIDGGENFTTSAEFTGLATGEYNIVVVDSNGDCFFEDTIFIDFNVSNQNHILNNKIKVSPNPTEDNFEIRIDASVALAEDVKIEVYSNLGSLITNTEIFVSQSSAQITLDDAPSGTYFVKCFTQDFEQYFKVIKM